MGCFDTVTFRCPKCGGEISEQSKAGKCDLSTFEGERGVPAAIAADIEGDPVKCDVCKYTFEILSTLQLDKIPLRLLEIDP